MLGCCNVVLGDESRHNIGSGNHSPKAEEGDIAENVSTPFPRSADGGAVGAVHRHALQQSGSRWKFAWRYSY